MVLFWESDPVADGDESLSTRLAEGIRCLAAREETVIIAGGAGTCGGMADIEMPKLAAENLGNAISFQVGKHAPVSTDKLVWGYRVLPGKTTAQQQLVRLVYMREGEWGKWVDHLSGLDHGVDLIIPATAVLDPLLDDRDVFVADPNGTDGFVFPAPANGSGRHAVRSTVAECEGAFGAGEHPLALPFLELGGLGAMSADDQRGYASAILLALYGLTRAPEADQHTWAPVPYELRPKRNRYSRMLAMSMLLYVIGIACFWLWTEYSAASQYYRRLKAEAREVKAQISALQQRTDSGELIQMLKKEIVTHRLDRPILKDVLLELTDRIDESKWVRTLEWTESRTGGTSETKIILKLKADKEDPGIIHRLEDSPFLGDVEPGGSTPDAEGVTLGLNMNARYDTEAERKDVELRTRHEEPEPGEAGEAEEKGISLTPEPEVGPGLPLAPSLAPPPPPAPIMRTSPNSDAPPPDTGPPNATQVDENAVPPGADTPPPPAPIMRTRPNSDAPPPDTGPPNATQVDENAVLPGADTPPPPEVSPGPADKTKQTPENAPLTPGAPKRGQSEKAEAAEHEE